METHSLSVCPSTDLPVVCVEAVNSHCRRRDLHGVKIKAWKQQQPIRGRDERTGRTECTGRQEGHFTDVSLVSEGRVSQGGRKKFP